MAGCRYYTICTYLHTFSILRAFSVYPLYIPVRSPLSARGLPAGRAALQLSARAVQGPGDSAGAPGAEQQPRFVMALRMLRRRCGPRCVWWSSLLCFSYTFLTVPVLRTDLRSGNLCMDMPISENDTQLFAKSCVSLSEYEGSIHKSDSS